MRSTLKKILATTLTVAVAVSMSGMVMAEETDAVNEEVVEETEAVELVLDEGEENPEDQEAAENQEDAENPEVPENQEDPTAPEEPTECEHEEVSYDAVEATLFTEGQTGGTYCSKCGEEITAPEIVPIKNLTKTLAKWCSGEEVLEVQEALDDLGYMAVAPDGVYGNYSYAAAVLFQLYNGLSTPDGKIGNWSIGVLRGSAVPFYSLSTGDSGNIVLYIQKCLKSKGYISSANGAFDNQTYQALCKYQLNNGMAVTGYGDLATLTSIVRGDGAAFRTLKTGCTGTDVRMIQQELQSLGYYYSSVDGIYGNDTTAVVKIFQVYNGLSNPDGMVGNWTYGKITGTSQAFYALQKGDSGNTVLLMQKYLKSKGYLSATPDGKFGGATETALKAFQAYNGLDVTGIADYATMFLLFKETGYSYKSLAYGNNGSLVTMAQKKLIELGYLDSEADGYFGSITKGAVMMFQAAHGLATPDGIIGKWTMTELVSETEHFRTIDSESNAAEIRLLQEALVSYGLLDYSDGVFGTVTSDALTAFQSSYNLTETGTGTKETVAALFKLQAAGAKYTNVQAYYSSTNWLIFINTTTNRMNVYYGSYGNWKMVYDWACTTGSPYTPTVLGEFSINYNRGYSFSGSSYTCYYYSSFYGAYLIHSVLYQKGTFDYMDSRLGYNLSQGCVRLDIENAKWIYYNIPVGTKVVVVE